MLLFLSLVILLSTRMIHLAYKKKIMLSIDILRQKLSSYNTVLYTVKL